MTRVPNGADRGRSPGAFPHAAGAAATRRAGHPRDRRKHLPARGRRTHLPPVRAVLAVRAVRAVLAARAGLSIRAVLAALCALLAVSGCGISTTGPQSAGAAASGVPRPGTSARTVQLYFAGSYGLRVVNRPTDRPLGPQQALELLLKGPTAAERERGLTTQVPPMAGQLGVTSTQGAVDLYVPGSVSDGDLEVTAIAQLVCTAAHSEVPGDRPAAQVDIRVHENLSHDTGAWTVRCGPDGAVHPVTG
jgi:hypothetical protein